MDVHAPPPVPSVLLAEYRQRRRAGEDIPVEAYFSEHFGVTSSLEDSALLDLIFGEVALREESGEAPSAEEYVGRFPRFRSELMRRFAQRREERAATSPAPFSSGASSGELRAWDEDRLPAPGDALDDFSIVRVLGTGSFGRVYLALERSLGRLVALKVTRAARHEARTLARLDHEAIVPIFSEKTDEGRNLDLLCMQYVAGTTLERLLAEMKKQPRETWDGDGLLDALQRLRGDVPGEGAGPRETREPALAGSDYVSAVCWIGQRLAEGLAHAHAQGVIHRDIKPANVLIHVSGRPLLADFNLSAAKPGEGPASGGEPKVVGCTLAYSCPEHIGLTTGGDGSPGVIDERSDLFSLGIVLREMLTGVRPFAVPEEHASLVAFLSARHRAFQEPLPEDDLPAPVHRTLQRCLQIDPEARFESASELASALGTCRHLRAVERDFPRVRGLDALVRRWPFIMVVALTLLPHVIASVVNISYNRLVIVSTMTAAQTQAFQVCVALYNLVAYPICGWLLFRTIAPALRTWRALSRGLVPPAELAQERRAMLRWPLRAVGLACLGWLPGAVLFPWVIDLAAGPVGPGVFGQFALSFTISGVIALTYSFFAAQYTVLCVLYPRFGLEAATPEVVAGELAQITRSAPFFYWLAALIPLGTAMGLLALTPTAGLTVARLLLVSFIALGIAGFGLALAANHLFSSAVHVLAQHARRDTLRPPLPPGRR